jgi:hypothetical protein
MEKYFYTNVFFNLKLLNSFKYSNKLLITKYVVLNVRSKLKVSTLVLDIVYKYNSLRVFTKRQQA